MNGLHQATPGREDRMNIHRFTDAIKIFMITALALIAAGCGGNMVSVTCDEFLSKKSIEREASVEVGKTVRVELCSNPSTGYAWGEATVSDPASLKQTGRGFVPPAEMKAGAPGTAWWTFETLKAGTSTVEVKYGQPWKGGEKDSWKFVLKINAK